MNNHKLNLWDYFNYRGDFEFLLAFCKLFWLDFIETDNCTFLAVQFKQEEFDEWKRQYGEDHQKIEMTINHVHL